MVKNGKKTFEEELAEAGNDPTAIKALTDKLIKQFQDVGGLTEKGARQIAEDIIPQNTQTQESFLKKAQETYKTLKDINDLQESVIKGSLTLEGAMSAIEKYGAQSVQIVGGDGLDPQYIADQSALELQRQEKELALIQDLTNATTALSDEKKRLIEASENDKDNVLNQQKN